MPWMHPPGRPPRFLNGCGSPGKAYQWGGRLRTLGCHAVRSVGWFAYVAISQRSWGALDSSPSLPSPCLVLATKKVIAGKVFLCFTFEIPHMLWSLLFKASNQTGPGMTLCEHSAGGQHSGLGRALKASSWAAHSSLQFLDERGYWEPAACSQTGLWLHLKNKHRLHSPGASSISRHLVDMPSNPQNYPCLRKKRSQVSLTI